MAQNLIGCGLTKNQIRVRWQFGTEILIVKHIDISCTQSWEKGGLGERVVVKREQYTPVDRNDPPYAPCAFENAHEIDMTLSDTDGQSDFNNGQGSKHIWCECRLADDDGVSLYIFFVSLSLYTVRFSLSYFFFSEMGFVLQCMTCQAIRIGEGWTVVCDGVVNFDVGGDARGQACVVVYGFYSNNIGADYFVNEEYV